MTSLKYTNKFKKLFAEAENQFTSAINTKMPGKDEQSATLVSPAVDPVATEHTQEEKAALTAKAMEKVKQSLEVSDELQSILNEIDKINKDVNANKWQLNDKDNTAFLPSKNAQIFKQNNYLCLSYNNNVELFNSVGELHDFLRKHNIPLPENIKLHEAVKQPEDSPFTKLWDTYSAINYPDNVITPEEREEHLKKMQKPMVKQSREQYIMNSKKDPVIDRIGDKLHRFDVATSKWVPVSTKEDEIRNKTLQYKGNIERAEEQLKDKKLTADEKKALKQQIKGWKKYIDVNKETPKKECGATVGNAVGPAVQYTGEKLNEEELQEVTPGEKGWKGGIFADTRQTKKPEFIDQDKINPAAKDKYTDWANINYDRADTLAPMWFKWVSQKLGKGFGINFLPEKDPNFTANAHNYVKIKHNPTTRSERETSSWRHDLWDKMLDKDPWLDTDKKEPNPNYGEFIATPDEVRAIAQDFKDKGYGDVLNGLDPNDPDLLKKFHPVGVPRPNGYRKPHELGMKDLPKTVYQANIDPEVRRKWYDDKTKGNKMNDEAYLLNYLASKASMSPEEYYDKYITKDVMPLEQDQFHGQRGIARPKLTRPQADPNITLADLQKKVAEPEKPATPAKKAAPTLSYFDQVKLMNQQKNQPRPANGIYGKKEATSLGQAFLELRKQNKDVPLKEDDSPADFATGQSAVASDMAAATDAAGGVDTTATDTTAQNMDYTADPATNTGAPFNNTPGFGDINIDAGGGDYSPDQGDQMAAPMPDAPEEKIIDVLVDENDPAKIKVKVKDMGTGKVTTKDLSEIDA